MPDQRLTLFPKIFLAAPWLFISGVYADQPIAGSTPHQRPAGAPVIEWVQHGKTWFQQALIGVQRPYPQSLYFLDNQGNWYTPFNRPGMRGPYDIRRWHKHQ